MLNVRVCGGVEVESDGHLLADALIGGRQGRLVLAYLVCERDRAVRREELAELLWPEQLPDSWAASLSAVISRLRRLFTEAGLDGTAVVASAPGSYQLHLPAGTRIDLEELIAAVADAEEPGDIDRALAAAARAEAIAGRGFLGDDCEWVDGRRLAIRDLRVRAAIAESIAHLGSGAAARAIEAARRAVELDEGKEAAYRQLMSALAAAGERAEALRVWERCRITLVEELGIDPSPETEAVYLQLLDATPPAPVTTELPSGVVTFLLTDIVESTTLWDEHPTAMAAALERHDAIVGEIVAAHGGTLLKSKLEGDATVSVFARATAAATAALALQDALMSEPWPEGAAPRLRMAMHTGEAFERGGDYFGPALNRAARLRSLAGPGEVLLSQAVTELVRDHLPDDVTLRDRGHRNLRGLSRGENVFQLVRSAVGASASAPQPVSPEIERPPVPAVLAGAGPFVGRQRELEDLVGLWERACAGESGAVFIGGEPGVGKSRLAGEIAQRAYAAGGLVLYGRCDEDLSAPLQPFIEAVRVLAPALGATRLRAVRGVDELTRVVPTLSELLDDEAPTLRADPDTERLALFDAVAQLLAAASSEAPVLLVLDDLHWAGKTTLSLVRHLLRGAKDNRLLVVGTYRDTELARTHPLAATLADLRRETDTRRITLSGLEVADVEAYLAAIGNTDRALGRELAEVTSGNPFFLIEVVRHVDETGGSWQPGSLPEGVRDATGRRLSRLSDGANAALSVAAVVGTTFDLDIVEQVVGGELVDPIAEACQAGLVVEEPGSLSRFRFAHALVRQVLLAELVSLKRVRLHRTIAELLEAAPISDPDARLADLAYHWFESASAGGADRAVTACHRAADRAMERLAYEEAGDLYGMALQALEWVDKADDETSAALHLARCDALLTAGDVAGARDAIDALELAAAGSERLAAWYTTYEGLLAVLGEPDRLGEIVQSIGAAAGAMRAVGDLTGEAKAHYVHASALERLGQIGAAERALDAALAAARSAGDRRLADAILAEAPPAALWGPSPVTRASGRCLDVVRVLRITSGAPAVEAVSLRCQAVLEALRGRMDAARRMIRSSHRTVERLGLTHRRLEAELAAGLIELLDGEAAAAETHLRVAYEDLRARGLGGEAAQAGAFLGRALLLQNRVDDADEVAADAQALAGSDLKAAIAWRGVRAEVAAQRGDTARALALAHEAVELASATDALLLVADARLALATVLRATGDAVAADAEAQRAVEACEAKGATVLADRARAGMLVRAPAPAAAPEPARPVPSRFEDRNLAFASQLRGVEAFNRGDWDALRANRTPESIFDDRRNLVAMTVSAERAVPYSEQTVYENGGRFDPPELITTRGQHVALVRCLVRAPQWEFPYLALLRVDEHGRIASYVMFEPEALDEAMAALDEAEGETSQGNLAFAWAVRFQQMFNRADWDAVDADQGPENTLDDRRHFVAMTTHPRGADRSLKMAHTSGGRLDPPKLIASRGQYAALCQWRMRGPDWEVPYLAVARVDNQGLLARYVMFEPEEIEDAFAALDEVAGAPAMENDATRYCARIQVAYDAHDWDAVVACSAPESTIDDRRPVIGGALDHEQSIAATRSLFDGRGTHEYTTIATRGRSLAIIRWQLEVRAPEATAAEHPELVDELAGRFPVLSVVRVDDHCRSLLTIIFDADDMEGAKAELDNQYRAEEKHRENDVTRYCARIQAAYDAHDWDAVVACSAPQSSMEDRRPVVGGSLDPEQSMLAGRLVFDGRGAHEYTTLATRGRSLALVRWTLRVSAPEASATVLIVIRTDEQGRHLQSIQFDPDDLEAALAELNAQYRAEAEVRENDATRAIAKMQAAYNAHDWDAVVACTAPQCTMDDRRSVVAASLDPEQSMAATRLVFDGGATHEFAAIATRGRSLALARWVLQVPSPEASATVLIILRTDNEGRTLRAIQFDEGDLEVALAELDALYLEEQTRLENDATRCGARVCAAYNTHDWDALTECFAAEWTIDDRRSVVGGLLDHEQAMATIRMIFDGGGKFEASTIAIRGRSLALRRSTVRQSEPEASGSVLTLTRTDAEGRNVLSIHFDVNYLEAAMAELDALYLEEQTRLENDATRAEARVQAAHNAHDWDALSACFGDEYTMEDRRSIVAASLDHEQSIAHNRWIFDGRGTWEREVIATRGRSLALARWHMHIPEPEARATVLAVDRTDARGLYARSILFNVDDLEAALAELDALYLNEEKPVENEATRTAARVQAAFTAHDWEALMAYYADDYTQDDRRSVVGGLLDHEHALSNTRWIFDGGGTLEYTAIATRGRSLALMRATVHVPDPEAIGVVLSVLRTDAAARYQRSIIFNADDLERATAELDSLYLEEQTRLENDATRTTARVYAAYNAQDWDALTACFAAEWTVHDRRSVVGGTLDYEQGMVSNRFVFDAGGTFESTIIATRGRSLVLRQPTLRLPEREASATVLSLTRTDVEGRITLTMHFDPHDLEAAIAELDALYRAEEKPRENDATRGCARIEAAYNAHDWDAVLAATAADWRLEDRRSVVGVSLDREQSMASNRWIFDGGGTLEYTPIATRGRSLALARWVLRVPSPEASATVLTVARTDAEGRADLTIQFEVEDLEQATAELDALYRAEKKPVENNATRALARVHAAFNTHDWDALSAALASDYTVDDRRSVVGVTLNTEQATASNRLIFDGGGTFESTPVATRGRSLALMRTTLHVPELEAGGTVLQVIQADAYSYRRVILFDPEDLEQAIAELDALYLEEQARLENDATRLVARVHAAFKAHDWDAAAGCYAEDWTQDDRRSVVATPLNREQSIASMRWIFDGGGVFETRDTIATRGRDLALTLTTLRVFDPEATVDTLVVTQVNEEGRTARSIAFDADDLESAMAELDALYLKEQARLENDATRTVARVHAAFISHDWDAAAACYADNWTQDDRRSVVGVPLDREQSIASMRWIFDGGGVFVAGETIATRGRNLALTRTTLRVFEPEAIVVTLAVTQVDEEGRAARSIIFDADDVDGAIAGLDALHAADAADAEPFANAAWRAAIRTRDAQNNRDWQAFLDTLDPAFVYIDHRQAVQMRLERDDALKNNRVGFEIDNFRLDRALLAARGEQLALVRDTAVFTAGQAGPSELVSLAIVECGPDGLNTSNTVFNEDDMEGAIAELDSMYLAKAQPFANAAWRAVVRVTEMANRRDWQGFVDALDPAFVSIDNRHGIQLRLERDGALDMFRVLFGLDDFTYERTLLATRGEHLALTKDRVAFRDGLAGPSEVVNLGVVECGADGLVISTTSFNPDDLEAAYDALDARYAELGGNPGLAVMRRSFDARDWEKFASLFTPDCTIGDYRTAGWGLIDRDTFVDYQKSIVELADDAHLWIDHTRTQGDVSFSTGRAFGTQAGGPFEIAFVSVGIADTDGRTKHFESYELSDFDVALARFDELVAAAEQPEPNRAWAAAQGITTGFERRDWDAIAEVLDPNLVLDDRRRGIAGTFVGEPALASTRAVFDADSATWSRRLLATAGDRVALGEVHFALSGGTAGEVEVLMLSVYEIGHDGRIARITSFDLEDIELARAEMHARAAALEPVPNRAVEVLRAQDEAFARRDWQAFQGTHSKRYVIDDRRRGIAFAYSEEESRANSRYLFDIEGATVSRRLIATAERNLALVESSASRHTGTVEDFEALTLTLVEIGADDLIERITIFDPDAVELASAEMHARAAALEPVSNRAAEVIRAQDEAFTRRDWDAYSGVYADGYVIDDRRTGIAMLHTAEESRATARLLFDIDDVEWSRRLLATAGSSLALFDVRVMRHGRGPEFESLTLRLVELDPAERIVRTTTFELEDIDAAMAELHARAAALDPLAIPRNLAAQTVEQPGWTLLSALGDQLCLHETPAELVMHEVDESGNVTERVAFDRDDRRGASDEISRRFLAHTNMPRRSAGMSIALNAHEFAAARASMADTCVVESHRRLQLTEFSAPDEYLAWHASAIEHAPDYMVESLRCYAVEPWGYALLVRASGTLVDAGRFENYTIAVSVWDESGLLTLIAIYEPEDVDAALERLQAARQSSSG